MSTPTRRPPLPPKKDVALALLQGPSLFIHLDPRKPEVIVPTQFKKQPQLVLQVGMNMAIPIPDLKVDDQGVTCTLSFNQRPFWCRLPWSAVYALVGEDMKGMIWPEEVPAEVAAQAPQSASPVARQRPARESKKKAGAPATVAASTKSEPTAEVPKPKGVAVTDDAEPPEIKPEQATPPKRDSAKSTKRELPPYLRVVK